MVVLSLTVGGVNEWQVIGRLLADEMARQQTSALQVERAGGPHRSVFTDLHKGRAIRYDDAATA